jgi:hypothetical protein
MSKYHLPRAIRESGYFDTRQLGTAAIISSGPWHSSIGALPQPSQQGRPLPIIKLVLG